ncbi:sugar phosphate isomerase/epimerase family protein [Flagellimonas allohymeniacidonis]|uniref:Sugar phosphate isomerase/epimerase n=1 Tax=Flagellimonas allohymeniacidonis TaxID=2517819 RepID=A0A4Q8QBM0_9FLAO|nr:TIM barrel protein [Allomuricauda hymeniacidonis]TAI47745.1 sugar phosphate isomerase/epimerase [Allomuricauda hymeniacidonis]
MKRREALKNTMFGVSALALASSFTKFNDLMISQNLEEKIALGVQLFTVPKMVDKDFKGTLQLISELGYKEVELFGPYPFSAQEAKDAWNQFKPMLGLENDAFYGYSIEETAQLLKDSGLSVPSMHTDFITLRKELDKMLDEVAKLEIKYLVLPAIQEEKNTLDHYKRFVEEFNGFGEKMSPYGIQFVYHNHGYEHVERDGKIPMHYLLQNTNSDYVKFELDIFWMQAAGADPIQFLKDYPTHYKMLHLKDASQEFRFSGDGGSPEQWMAGFPLMSDPGDGVYDIAGIIKQAKASGVEHYYLERDIAPNPEETLKNSFKNLSELS